MRELLLLAIAFLSGSIPFGLLIGKAKGIDVRKHGSGNIGSTNVGRVLGRKYFFICFALDVMKGLLPTLAAGKVLGYLGQFEMPARDAGMWLAVMVTAVLGHVFSPWLKFKGGKGVATALGALLGVFPALTLAGAADFALWLIALALWRTISISSIISGFMLPVCIVIEFFIARQLGWIKGPILEAMWPFLLVGIILGTLVLWTHRSNMKRLRAGTEPKIGQKPIVTPT
jgi:glycerol-3-phosphate acyltransferase PlsY